MKLVICVLMFKYTLVNGDQIFYWEIKIFINYRKIDLLYNEFVFKIINFIKIILLFTVSGGNFFSMGKGREN
jgi:hypothetical protein